MEHQETGKVWLAGAGPGDAGLLTCKAKKVLESADVVKLNEEEFPVLASMFGVEENLETFARRFGLQMVLRTLGPDGCDLYAEGRIIHSPAYPVKVVSTVGAGDSFSAAFLYRWLTGETLEKALEAGNRLAAEVAGHKGAV